MRSSRDQGGVPRGLPTTLPPGVLFIVIVSLDEMLRWSLLLFSVAFTRSTTSYTGPFGDEAFGRVATQGVVLLEWAQREGADVSKVSIAAGEFGNSLIVNEATAADELLLHIPYEVAMSPDSAKNSSLYGEAMRDLERRGASSLVLVVLHLLREREAGAQSRWSPYIQALPAKYNTLLDFSEEELSLLDGTIAHRYWVQNTLPRYQAVRDFVFNTAHAWHPKLFKYKEEYLKWAFSTVISRAWEFGGEVQLVPVADMANHRSQETNLVRQHSGGFRDGGFRFKLERDHQQGEQFFQSYDDGSLPGTGGAKCDHQLLADYGFLPKVFQCLPLAIRITLEKMPVWKRRVFQETGLLQQQTTILSDGTPSNVTLAVARLALLDDENSIEGWEEDHGRLQRGPISPMNEVQTLGLLTKMIKSLANRKSVEKDEAALQDPASAQMSTNRRLALLYRLRQQKGLELALARLREMKGRVAL